MGEVGASLGADQSRAVPWEQNQPRTQTVGQLSHHRNHTSAFLFHGAYYDPNLISETQIVLRSKSLPMNNFCLLVRLLFWFGETSSLCSRNQAKSLPSRTECAGRCWQDNLKTNWDLINHSCNQNNRHNCSGTKADYVIQISDEVCKA